MTFTDAEVTESVNGSCIADIQAAAKEIGVQIAAEHLTWCEYVWSKGARFAVLPGKLPEKGMGIVAARDIGVCKISLIPNAS